MYNELVAFYLYGVACLVGGLTIGYMWRNYKDD